MELERDMAAKDTTQTYLLNYFKKNKKVASYYPMICFEKGNVDTVQESKFLSDPLYDGKTLREDGVSPCQWVQFLIGSTIVNIAAYSIVQDFDPKENKSIPKTKVMFIDAIETSIKMQNKGYAKLMLMELKNRAIKLGCIRKFRVVPYDVEAREFWKELGANAVKNNEGSIIYYELYF